ncbi:MAG: hypothetical protein HOE90_11585 [Bacteriovoracaceae bacterium]|nr:hypothetical protein [Bacteriovoracaceae bacterium]
MLLPVTDNMKGAYSYKVFVELERYLKDCSWCYYKHNSGVINILKGYSKNLEKHLASKEVLSLVARKTKTGSLIKVHLTQNQDGGIDVDLKVYGQNGIDLYFKEKDSVDEREYNSIPQKIINWLEAYDKVIPYDGKIVGILGDQITVDIGKASSVKIGRKIVVRRPLRKKHHPLLKEIVDWESELVARGQVFKVSEFQAFGTVSKYVTDKKLRMGDWVRLEKILPGEYDPKTTYPELKKEQFGKIGFVDADIIFGMGSHTTLFTNSRKFSGTHFGINLYAEVWATRNFWGGLEIGRTFGTYSKSEGTSDLTTNGVAVGRYKFAGGYKWLPMGFFYGPQVDVYTGYRRYSFNYDAKNSEGIGETAIRGILLGVKGSMPIMKSLRIFALFEAVPLAGMGEEEEVYGDDKSSNIYTLKLGGSYEYTFNVAFRGYFEMINAKAKFDGSKELSHNNMNLGAGASYSF